MAFLHAHSCECAKSELDLFTLPPTQTSLEGTQWIEYKPVTSISEDSYLEFLIPGNSDDYIDLAHTMINLSVRLEKGDSPIEDKTLVAPVNNFLHSIFNQVDVFFNQKAVSPPSNAYAYRAYIETLLNYLEEAKKSHLTCALWCNDTPGHMDAALQTPSSDGKTVFSTNLGACARRDYTKGGKTIDLLGHLHADVFNQETFLLNGVEVRVRLIRSKEAFCLINYEAENVKVKILDASLRVRRAKINPGILLAHSKALSKGTAKFPLTRVEVKSFTLHTGITGETLDNIILGQIPKRIIIGLVSNKAFNGSKKENSFNFQHFNLNYLAMSVDGIQIPSRAIQPNYPDRYVDAYHTLFSGTGIHFANDGNDISRTDYPHGYCLYAFDLTSDLSANCNTHWNLIKNGTIRLELRFESVLQQSVNCIVYAEYDNILEIDSTRQVIVDFGG
ncbi:uncharacterized protein F54H12.2-like [Nasonia vitripennis]|uniref:Uncharacterized protein n=1 Tax=Nasonia vitripennis TaxID=7425 RepID=A0A7M7T7D2_NASVI|nr:uncharacterized protein F54H12.2-like [Nasonia vitripennis]